MQGIVLQYHCTRSVVCQWWLSRVGISLQLWCLCVLRALCHLWPRTSRSWTTRSWPNTCDHMASTSDPLSVSLLTIYPVPSGWWFLPGSDPDAWSPDVKGFIKVSKLQGIDLFYYLLDLRELASSNDMHKASLVLYFERNSRLNFARIVLACTKPVLRSRVLPNSMECRSRKVLGTKSWIFVRSGRCVYFGNV